MSDLIRNELVAPRHLFFSLFLTHALDDVNSQSKMHLAKMSHKVGIGYMFFLISAYLTFSVSASYTEVQVTCPIPSLPQYTVFKYVTPVGNQSAGIYSPKDVAVTLNDCICECVADSFCNVAFFFKPKCFNIQCRSKELCEPLERNGKKFGKSYMTVVREPGHWDDLNKGFSGLTTSRLTLPEASYFLSDAASYDEDDDDITSKDVTPLILERSDPQFFTDLDIKVTTCVFGLHDCPENEHCEPKNNRARSGMCSCDKDYTRDKSTHCVLIENSTTSPMNSDTSSTQNISTTKENIITTTGKPVSSTTSAPTHLVVSAGSNVSMHLPENSVTLSAYALNREGDDLKFDWTLVSHPEGGETGIMQDQNTKSLRLSKLQVGVYTFKVTVTGNNSIGDAAVNVTVLPPEHPNEPPVAVIQPSNVIVKLPITETVLDGSFSTDDDKITKYQWDVVQMPISYSLHLNDTSTLALRNLIPGFYRFKLTVTDSKGASNFTFANVTVQKEIDYPPTANANSEVVIYLPQNEVTLNGNLSTDDKGIKAWEWKKSADTDKAVDMEGTNSPYLHLSQLEVGVYKFILKVTDTADQTSTTEVHLLVKPETNSPPVAITGPDQKITLPLKAPILLDGSQSKDDIKIASYHWQQLQGPKDAVLTDINTSIAKASGLVPGLYQFQLTVEDDKRSNSTALLNITVIQTQNMIPRANAGGDKSIYLPCDLVVVNGSASSDDIGIVKYVWTRDSASLAAGTILDQSDQSPVLKLTNLITGRYLFRLTVFDMQGASSSDTASLIVKSPSNLMDEVEVVVNVDVKSFTQEQEDTLLKQLEMLLHVGDPIAVKLIKLDYGHLSRRVVLVILVEKMVEEKRTFVPGTEVVSRLKRKLRTDNSLLDLEILAVDTVVCQNLCSGHGSCDQYAKRCICEAFWMQNVFRLYFGDKESNCDWSILYVIIISFIIVVLMTGVIWAVFCCCMRMRFRRPRKRHRYTLLNDFGERDQEREKFLSRGKIQKSSASSLMVSDTDSDAIFVAQRVPLTETKASNGIPNGLVRDAHRVTT